MAHETLLLEAYAGGFSGLAHRTSLAVRQTTLLESTAEAQFWPGASVARQTYFLERSKEEAQSTLAHRNSRVQRVVPKFNGRLPRLDNVARHVVGSDESTEGKVKDNPID